MGKKIITAICSISVGTWVRTALLVIALVNQILVATGHSVLPFDDETVTEVVTYTFTAITAVAAWWKNNSFTSEAIEADNMLNKLKKDEDK